MPWNSPFSRSLRFFVGLVVTTIILLFCMRGATTSLNAWQDAVIENRVGGLGTTAGDLVKLGFQVVGWLGAGAITFVYLLLNYGFRAAWFVVDVIQGRRVLLRPRTVDHSTSKGKQMFKSDQDAIWEMLEKQSKTLTKYAEAIDSVNDAVRKLIQHSTALSKRMSAVEHIVQSLDERLVELEPEPVIPKTPEEIQAETIEKLKTALVELTNKMGVPVPAVLNEVEGIKPATPMPAPKVVPAPVPSPVPVPQPAPAVKPQPPAAQ